MGLAEATAETTANHLPHDARFFEYLQKGTGKLDALSRARQDVREQGYDHPFFWAPFILVGEVN